MLKLEGKEHGQKFPRTATHAIIEMVSCKIVAARMQTQSVDKTERVCYKR